MSESTLISIVPFPIDEFKPGIYPGQFYIPASKNNVPEVLVIGDSVFHVEVDENRSVTVKVPSEDMAASIIYDYSISNLEYAKTETKDICPGVFWKPGAFTATDILTTFKKDLDAAKDRQREWFVRLVKLADDDWEKTGQHKFISDMQRYAARFLNLDRPWLISSESTQGNVRCAACQTIILSVAIVCPNCKLIRDKVAWEKLSFAKV